MSRRDVGLSNRLPTWSKAKLGKERNAFRGGLELHAQLGAGRVWRQWQLLRCLGACAFPHQASFQPEGLECGTGFNGHYAAFLLEALIGRKGGEQGDKMARGGQRGERLPDFGPPIHVVRRRHHFRWQRGELRCRLAPTENLERRGASVEGGKGARLYWNFQYRLRQSWCGGDDA